jgi:S1/P1 Nuclease
MKIHRVLSIILVILFAQIYSLAWSGPGHAAVAAMAYRELNKSQKSSFTTILKQHPKADAWGKEFNAKKAGFPKELDLGMFLFIRAATWPDDIKHSGAEFDHPNWHFVDYPINLPDFDAGERPQASSDDDIIFGIDQCLDSLRNTHADDAKRAAMLSTLIHLVGDIHQPLHAATLFGENFDGPNGDVGGNSFIVLQKKGGAKTKLHSFWDGRLGSDKVPDAAQALSDAKMLKGLHSRESLDEMSAGNNTAKWSIESRSASISDVYRFNNRAIKQNKVLPKGYIDNSHTVARRRLALAGYRLADELKGL